MKVLVVAATERELGGLPGLVCGIGPVEAAAVTSQALAERLPGAVLHVGVAGARRASGIRPPHLVLGSASVYCDIAAEIPVLRGAKPDPALLAVARRVLPDAHVLPIGTSAAVDGSHGVDVEAMEGFGVLRACALAGVPALELRAVANEIEEADRSRWHLAEALEALATALPALVRALSAA